MIYGRIYIFLRFHFSTAKSGAQKRLIGQYGNLSMAKKNSKVESIKMNELLIELIEKTIAS